MKLIITVVNEIINDLNQRIYQSDISGKLLETLRNNAASLKPLYSNSSDPVFQRYFIVDIDSEHPPATLLDELWKSGAITSAYVKPKEEAP